MMDTWAGVKQTIETMGLDDGDLRPGTELVFDLGMDSLEMANFAQELETVFNIEIPDAEMNGVRTIGDAVEMIRKLRGEN